MDEKEISKKVKALEKASGKKVFPISAIAKQGLFDCLNAVSGYITRERRAQEKEDEKINVVQEVKKAWSPLD